MTKNKKGFTIIEVVLVLAIAGLIFLMVFIALPALQRSQRNTRRRQDMSRILSAFTDYQSNVGHMPTDGDLDDFVQKYIGAAKQKADGSRTDGGTECDGDQFCDPDGTPYALVYAGVPTAKGGGTSKRYDGASTMEGRTGDPEGNDVSHFVYYWNNAVCDETEGVIKMQSGKNNVALAYRLEGGAIYCGDNQ